MNDGGCLIFSSVAQNYQLLVILSFDDLYEACCGDFEGLGFSYLRFSLWLNGVELDLCGPWLDAADELRPLVF